MAILSTKIDEAIYKGATSALTFLTHPIATLTGGFKKAYTQTESQSAIENVIRADLNTLAVLSPLTSVGRTAIVATAKSLIPKSVVGKVAAGGAAIIGGSTLISSKTAREAVGSATEKAIPSLVNIGKNLGGFIDMPSISSAEKIYKENPVAVGSLAALGVLVGGYKSAGTVANIINADVTRQNTLAIKELGTNIPTEASVGAGSNNLPKEKPIQSDDSAPITPELQNVTTSSGTRKYRARKAQKQGNISIRIDNRDTINEGKVFKEYSTKEKHGFIHNSANHRKRRKYSK
jgi:hypothetical protein